MKKMPTLFEREFEGHHVKRCLNKVTEGCEWVLAGEGFATERWNLLYDTKSKIISKV